MKRQGNKRKTLKERKRLCSGSSRKKKGWLDMGIQLFSLLCRQVDKQQQQTILFEQHIRQTFKEEYNQSRGENTDEALDEQTSVIQDTDYNMSRRIGSLLCYDNTEVDMDNENKDSDSDELIVIASSITV